MTCRYRYVFPDGSQHIGEQTGSPAQIEATGYQAGALGVTVVVLPPGR